MIITRLNGGLGNQMFQYAAARRLAEVHGTPLKLDISKYASGNDKRAYGLGHFNIIEEFATSADVRGFKRYQESKKPVIGFLYNAVFADSGRYIEARSRDFEPRIIEAGGDVYLDGFWQSHKYFEDISGILLREFTLRDSRSNAFTAAEHAIRDAGSNSVAVHIRRGDYAPDKESGRRHTALPVSYYHNAFKEIKKHAQTPHYFIFSDEPEWAKKNMLFSDKATFIADICNLTDYEELLLMAACRHAVIANSTFSWWGAWLNPSTEKTVIAPREWYNKVDFNPKDRIPPDWQVIAAYDH